VRLAVVGGLQVDNVVTPTGEVGLQVAGGNGLHAAAGARLWAGNCRLIGARPANFPTPWLDELRRAGVDTAGVRSLTEFTDPATEWLFYKPDGSRRDFLFASLAEVARAGVPMPTGFEQVLCLDLGGRLRLEQVVQALSHGRAEPRPQRHEQLTPDQVLERLDGAHAVHLSPNTYDVHLALAKKLVLNGRLVSLDPGHYVKGMDVDRLAELLKSVTIFAPSEREVIEFRGPCAAEQAARDFADLGPSVVVIKLGPKGSYVFDQASGSGRHVAALAVQALDPTGCGDSYCGGFLAGYAETGQAVEAAFRGTVSASFSVEGFGATYTLRFTREDALRRRQLL
jgi:ribokinase